MKIVKIRRTHLAKNPVELDYSKKYKQKSGCKPSGLWYQIEGNDDWSTFCIEEEFRLENLAHSHIVELDVSRILRVEDIGVFTNRYPENNEKLYINWIEVAKQYAGVEIWPYRWEARTAYNWYYTWDCASGCIWDLSAIKEFKLEEA